jgi:hypothetical protein
MINYRKKKDFYTTFENSTFRYQAEHQKKKCAEEKNEKFWEELISHLLFLWHGQHRKRRVQQFLYCCVCIRCRCNPFTSRCIATIEGYTYWLTDWWDGFTKYAFEIGSGAMIYIPSLIKIRHGVQKLTVGIHRHTSWGSHMSAFTFQNKESRLKMRLPAHFCTVCMEVLQSFLA